MSKTVLIHSFRHGVGRSTITANLAYLLATGGRRVGLIDTDTRSPVIHYLFGLQDDEMTYSFNDFLEGTCDLVGAAQNITARLNNPISGQLFLVPGNTNVDSTSHDLLSVEDAELFNNGCRTLNKQLKLDILLIDTQAGVNEQSLVAITVCDLLVIILRLDHQDYEGTGVTVDLVRELSVPHTKIIVNEAPASYEVEAIKSTLQKTYNCDVAAVLPHVDEVMALATRELFTLHYPDHSFTKTLKAAALSLMAV